MRIKRTFAATMREALLLVKQEQGGDAVILGNKKVPGGVEIISAIDFDEQALDADPIRTGKSSRSPAATYTPANNRKSENEQLTPADAWVGSLINDRLNDRKEPTLGSVAKSDVKKVIQPARQPDWLEQELNREKTKHRPENNRVSNVDNARPLKQVSKKPPVVKPKTAEVAKPVRAAPQVAPKQPAAIKTETSNEFVIGEVKHELQNLRDLMESQLSVLQWDRFSQKHPVRSVLLNLMTELGLGADICKIVLSRLTQLDDDPHKVWQQALGILAKCIPITRHDILANGGRIALVGSTGVGKTTTIAKLAARFAHVHGKRSVAMISTDHFRIGAQEQLQHFARLLEIPMLIASNSEELSDSLEMLTDKKLVLIDTAGMSQHDLRLSEQFHQLQLDCAEIRPYLVLSANTQLAALNQTIQSFKKVKLAGAFVTKLDEAASLGGIITASIRHHLALGYCGTGQRVPEDLESAKTHRLISQAVSLMQRYSEQTDQESLAHRYQHIINNNRT